MTSKRQLTLPGLPPTNGRRARPLKRAKRDWTEAEFARALRRYNITPECDNLRYVDVDGPTGARVFDAVTRSHPIRIARRATLARILKQRGGRSSDGRSERGQNRVSESPPGCQNRLERNQRLGWWGR